MTPTPWPAGTIDRLLRRIAGADVLDPVGEAIAGAVRRVLPAGAVKDAVHGTWLGHPLHPILTDLPIGAWTGALALDAFGGDDGGSAAEAMIAIGLVSALPTALTGLVDWSETDGPERRLGLVHALANYSALALYAASLLQRRRGRRPSGMALSLAGAAALTAGGYIGGHLAYRSGVGVDRTAFLEGPDDWTEVAAEADLTEGRPVHGVAAGADVLLVRQGGRLHAISDRCTHLGGPLHEGEVSAGCVVCPWHRSTFSLETGAVVHGPATHPEPVFDVRVSNGTVQVRNRRTGH